MAAPPNRLFLGIIPWYGLLITLGMILAVILADREAKRMLLAQDTVIDLALLILPAGILGARLYYVLFAWIDFRASPLSVLAIWKGGLAIYGGLIGGFCAVVWFCRRRGISLPLMLDILMPGMSGWYWNLRCKPDRRLCCNGNIFLKGERSCFCHLTHLKIQKNRNRHW